MCSKKFSVVKSGPPQANFFLELTVVEPSVGDFLGCCLEPSDPFLFVCAVNNFTLYFFTQTSPPSSA